MTFSRFLAENRDFFAIGVKIAHVLLHSALRCPDVAIDLGTANTRLFATGRGLLAETPSIVGGMFHPLRGGVIVDIGGAAELLEPLIGRVRRLAARPRALACVPSDATSDETKALRHATRAAGARDVAIVAEPLAAAIGAGLDVASPYAHMLVDLGDGVTDLAVIREGQMIRTAALRVSCSDRSAHDEIASFFDDFVRDLPAAVAAEVIESGACATGGGARNQSLVDLLRTRSGIRVTVAHDPLHAVINGAARILTGPGARTLWK